MSDNKQNPTNFPDASSGKVTDDKCRVQESCDSGYLSGEITYCSDSIGGESSSSARIEKQHDKQELGKVLKEQEEDIDDMRVDSGVCLSENFSQLSLKGYNDLNSSSLQVKQPVEPKEKHQTPVVFKTIGDYYRQDEDGNNYLHYAIYDGYVDLVLALIKRVEHPKMLDTPNDDAQTALHLAAESGQSVVVRWLVVAGARPCPRDFKGDSPLHIAARNGDEHCVRAICEPVHPHERAYLGLDEHQSHVYQPSNLDQWNYLGQTCVHVAAINGQSDVLKSLISYGSDVNAREGCMGYTALHYAVEHRNEQLVNFLLQCDKLDVETLSYGGRTALEVTLFAPAAIKQALKSRGLSSPTQSDTEESDSEDEVMAYETNYTLSQSVQMVNASA